MKPFLALLLLLVPQADPTVQAILKEGKANNQVMAHLDHLSHKIGPRLTSSTRLTEACEWTRSQFEQWGLKARLEEWGTFPVGFDRGPWSARMIAPEELTLTAGTASWSAGTNGPVTTHAVLGPETDEQLAKVKGKLKGAWVVSTATLRTGDKYQAALDEAGIAGTIRSTGGELLHTSGNSRISWDNLPKRVVVNVIKSQHEKIVQHLKDGKEVRLAIDIKNEFKQGPIKLYNVIADLPGREKPDEYVIVGGHIDSWDGATGAQDNGTGVSTTLEAARILAKVGARPKRTIRFMLWSGEEQGLLGSRAWVTKHRDEMAKISAVLVHDMGTNYLSGIAGLEKQVPILEKIFAPVMNLDAEMKFSVRQTQALMGGGSDHASFLSAGVPGFFWRQSGRTSYQYIHHTQHDRYDQAVPEYQKHSAIVVAVGAWGIANLDGMMPRDGMRAGGGGTPTPSRRVLGVQLEADLTIQEVSPESPAEKAGLKAGDRILRIDGKEVTDQASLRAAVQAAPRQTKVRVKRGDKEIELQVTFPDARLEFR